MKKCLFIAGLLSLSAVESVQAGLYLPMDPGPWPLPSNPRQFMLLLEDRQNVGSRDPRARSGPLRLKVEQRIKNLEGKAPDTLTAEECLDLGGGYVLQGANDRAIEVLGKAASRFPRDPLLRASLATAYQGKGEFDLAYRSLQQSLQQRWNNRPDWLSAEQFRWYRRVEEYYQKLLERRQMLAAVRGSRPAQLDLVFPRLNQLTVEDNFKPGTMVAKIAVELPPDALAIVEQLLLWLPHDRQLLWLFAELVNGQGEIELAERLYSFLVQDGFASDAVHVRRKLLRQAIEEATPPPPEAPPWFPDWRSVVVGLASGFLVGVLFSLQMQQLARRSSRRSSPPTRPLPQRVGQAMPDEPGPAGDGGHPPSTPGPT